MVGKAYEFSLWMIQKVENFPRSFRFSVGDRLVATALDVQLRLVDAAYARDKGPILTSFHDYWRPAGHPRLLTRAGRRGSRCKGVKPSLELG